MNNTNSVQANDHLSKQSRQALDATLEEMDGASLSRLNQIRQTALAEAQTNRWNKWVPAGAAATACVLLLAINLSSREAVDPARIDSPLGDLDLLSSNEDLEMLEELEFYAWLETELEES